jgi:hypothetical protein
MTINEIILKLKPIASKYHYNDTYSYLLLKTLENVAKSKNYEFAEFLVTTFVKEFPNSGTKLGPGDLDVVNECLLDAIMVLKTNESEVVD